NHQLPSEVPDGPKQSLEPSHLGLVDPHGDLAAEVLRLVPVHRRYDLILLEPSTPSGRIALNPLQVPDPTQRPRAASGLVGAVRKIWADSCGPRVEYILYNTLRALLDFPGSSLLDVPRVLSDKSRDSTVSAPKR